MTLLYIARIHVLCIMPKATAKCNSVADQLEMYRGATTILGCNFKAATGLYLRFLGGAKFQQTVV